MGSLSAYASEQESLGYFRIFATPPSPKDPKDKKRREITIFRGAPITVTSVSTADPVHRGHLPAPAADGDRLRHSR